YYLMVGIAQTAFSHAAPTFASPTDMTQLAAQTRAFNIPAQPLATALAAFARQSGRQMSYDPAITTGVTAHGVSGTMAPEAALATLLAGTPVHFHRLNASTLVLDRTASSTITLGPVRVGGATTHQDPTGPGIGYVAENTLAGTKTDTPITEIPNSIYVVTKQQMIDQQPQNVQEALRYVAGVRTEGAGTYGDASPNTAGSIMQRGFDTKQFVDGLLTESTSAGETAFLDRIEVVNGPASVMYGQSNPGGLLATSLKKPTDTPLHQVSLGFGNWGRYELTADVSDKLTQSGNVRYRVAAIGVTQGTQTDHIDYHRVGVLPSITWDIDPRTSLTLTGMYMYTPGNGVGLEYPLLGTMLPLDGRRISRRTYLGLINANTQSSRDAMFEYQFSHTFNRFISFRQVFRWENSNDSNNSFYYDGTGSPGQVYLQPWWTQDRNTTTGLDTRIFGKFDTGPLQHTWVVGSDFRMFDWDFLSTSDKSGNEPLVDAFTNPTSHYVPCYSALSGCTVRNSVSRFNYFQEGVYFQDQIKWKGLSILLGGRQDWVNYGAKYENYSTTNAEGMTSSQSGASRAAPQPQSAFTWRAGLVYTLPFGLSPYFSYATSFIPQNSTNWQGQPFAPLTGQQFEAGLKYKVPHRDILLTASAFHIDENHYLISDITHSGYQYDGGRVRSQGVEVSANANVTRDLRLVASYTFTDLRFARTNKSAKRYDPYTDSSYGDALSQQGMSVPNIPRNMFSLFADYTFPIRALRGLGINGGMRYTGTTYGDSVESFKTPAYLLFDIGTHYDLGHATSVLKGLKAQIAISNLTNKYYTVSCTSWACNLGQGRKIYGNLTYNW
ncbi:MAG: TonB-dependent siderophore receptor, partial [Gluconacetobacter liquefaciens]